MKTVLVLNSGSSSLKFCLVNTHESGQSKQPSTEVGRVVSGSVKGIGQAAVLRGEHTGQDATELTREVKDHTEAVAWIFEYLATVPVAPADIDALGFRVVHGGTRLIQPVLIDDQVLSAIESLSVLAPLHNPACVEGINAARTCLGAKFPMVAVFDTAFHHTMPARARNYALPHDLSTRLGIQRFGFHGIAHASLASGYTALTGRQLKHEKLITLQLGNGCSMTAINGGKSVETSMGFTPLEGLVMGTRSGDLDPSILGYLARNTGMDVAEVERVLNEESGLLGLSGRTNDMATLLHAARNKDERAAFAVELFCYRIQKYVGAYLAALHGANAIVFGGGIGENAPEIRARILSGMEWCDLRLDVGRNKTAVGLSPGEGVRISEDGADLAAYVVATDEESYIASETVKCVHHRPHA